MNTLTPEQIKDFALLIMEQQDKEHYLQIPNIGLEKERYIVAHRNKEMRLNNNTSDSIYFTIEIISPEFQHSIIPATPTPLYIILNNPELPLVEKIIKSLESYDGKKDNIVLRKEIIEKLDSDSLKAYYNLYMDIKN